MHIGLLITNTDDSEFARARPLDAEKFTLLLQPLRPDWVFAAVQVTDGVFPASIRDFDGYLIGGSPASVHDDAPWIARLLTFIRKIDTAGIPTVGVCFGHQAIALALGGKVGKNPGGWGFGAATTTFFREEPWMLPARRSLTLYAAHSEQVTQLPDGAVALGGNPFCPVASYKIGGHIFTTEYHPEISQRFMADLIEECADDLGPAVAARAREQIALPADGAIFAEWALRFLEMPR